jgi:hypothetical protein
LKKEKIRKRMIFPNPSGKPKKAFMIGDTHFQWTNKRYLYACYEKIEKLKPDYVIQMGDLYDFYSFSRYPGPQIITAQEEIINARATAEEFWNSIKQIAPRAIKLQLWGNHDDRFIKRIHDRLPEAEGLLESLDWKKFWRFSGVKLQEDSREEVKIDLGGKVGEVWFFHGYLTQQAAHTKYTLHNCVTAHTHRAELSWIPHREKNLFEMNVGYVADQSSPVMRYSPQKYSKSIAGYGYIDEEGPHVISF